MLGDQLFLCERSNGAEITIPAAVWSKWEDRFCEVVIEKHCCKSINGRNVTFIDQNGWPASTPWGRLQIVATVFPNVDEYIPYFFPDCAVFLGENSVEFIRINEAIFDAFKNSAKVQKTLLAHIAKEDAAKGAVVIRIREALMMRIRVDVDNESALPVKFIIPNAKAKSLYFSESTESKSLYYIVGDNIFYIKDITSPNVRLDIPFGKLVD